MKNLDQIRAANALEAAKKYKNMDEVVKKVPAMIRENGILAAAAFALDKDNEHANVFRSICEHLRSDGVNKLESSDAKTLVEKLVRTDSAKLRAVTAEAMAYLNYLRRFAQ